MNEKCDRDDPGKEKIRQFILEVQSNLKRVAANRVREMKI